MRTIIGAALLSIGLLSTASAQPQKNDFSIRVAKVTRAGEGCSAVVYSETVRFEISSNMPAHCSILRAGEKYKAMRAYGAVQLPSSSYE